MMIFALEYANVAASCVFAHAVALGHRLARRRMKFLGCVSF